MPQGCRERGKSDSQIVVKHRPGCQTGATVSLQVNLGQALNASLGAGSLEFAGFASVTDSLGRVSAETKIGTVDVPLASGFSKTFDNYVGRSYEREGNGPDVELKVNAGLIKVLR
ncbi:MAG: hypothetical protein HC902_03135 [Calothrix sp. SM1_5_4]|nr:hypothetical protein [Calothrix sp. SM1_5_4]